MKTDNELIAEFMKSEAVNSPHLRTAKELEDTYNYSWDWLMPVVEKIHKLWEQYPVVDWQNDKEFMMFTDVVAIPVSEKIEVVYKAVVEFVKWYNSQAEYKR